MLTTYSLTPNDAASTTDCPLADHPRSGPTTQMHRATFSARFPACLAVEPMDRRGRAPLLSNQGRGQTRIASLAMYSKMCVSTLLQSPQARAYYLQPASPARGRTASPALDLVRCGMWCWSRLHHGQHARSCRGRVRGESTRSRQRCQRKECRSCVRRIKRGPEGRGA